MTKPISPLRQRMIDDMTMRNLSASTQETYIRSVAQFSAFHRRSPDKLGVEHVRDFHLHLVSRGLVANSIAVKMAALRFFYGTSLRRADIAAEIPTPRRSDRLPAVLARAEVRSEEHTSELQSLRHLVCRLLLEKKKKQSAVKCH